MARWMVGTVAAFVVIFAATVTITGNPQFIWPALVLVALLAAYTAVNRALTYRIVRRDGSLEQAMSDNTDPIPSAHLVPDDATAAGDTPEAHDEISPHDLPVDHPGRAAAEVQAAANAARGGSAETHGDAGGGVAEDTTAGARAEREGRFSREPGPQDETAATDATRGPRPAT
jgi:hypothetical protein